MILVDEFIHLNVSQDFMDVFLVVIQLGAILAVVVLYWNKLWPFYIKKLPRRTQMAIAKKPKWAQVILNFVERFCDKEKWVLWFKIVVACLPTIVIALPFDDFIEEFDRRGIKYHMITGAVDKKKRKEEVDAFQNHS